MLTFIADLASESEPMRFILDSLGCEMSIMKKSLLTMSCSSWDNGSKNLSGIYRRMGRSKGNLKTDIPGPKARRMIELREKYVARVF